MKPLLDDDSYDSDISDSSVTMTLTSAENLSPKSSVIELGSNCRSIEGMKFTRSSSKFDESNYSPITFESLPPLDVETNISCYIKPAFFVPDAQKTMQKSVDELIKTVGEALANNEVPVEAQEGVTGAFIMKKIGGASAAIFKPEELLSRRASFNGHAKISSYTTGVKLSDCAVREVAAFILDHESYARVPETVMVQINWRNFSSFSSSQRRDVRLNSEIPFKRSHSLKQSSLLACSDNSEEEVPSRQKACVWKIGSLQKFVEHDDTACDISWSKFNSEQIHRLGLFDVRVLNTDRHEGNILVKLKEKGNYDAGMDLIPIDHGLILPDFEHINVEGNFCWMSWPQSKEKFSNESKKYIENLDAQKDCQQLIRLLGSRVTPRGLFSLKLGTQILKTAALKFDLSLQEIGNLIVGDWQLPTEEKQPSPLQTAISRAVEAVGSNDPSDQLLKAFQKQLEFVIEARKTDDVSNDI